MCKILLESRAFVKSELKPIINKMLHYCISREKKHTINELILNEIEHYIEPNHKSELVERLWDLASAVHKQKLIEMSYKRLDGMDVIRTVKPLGILFSEFYFYLIGDISEHNNENYENQRDTSPTIYRIDRIKDLKITNEYFSIPYKNRFEAGEFRKRVQFMWGGKLERLELIYRGSSVECLLDRIPTSEIIRQENDEYHIKAEIFGRGVVMWLLGQGDNIEVIKPESMREEIKKKLSDMVERYEN